MNARKGSLCLVAALVLASSQAMAVTPKQYNALIKKARQGDYEPALQMLRERNQEKPSDRRALYDHILIAGWAGKTDEIISVYEAMGPAADTLPASALSTVARAYRDTKQWDKSLVLYREGVRRFPGDAQLALGEIMVLAETGHEDEAIAKGRALVRSAPNEPDRRLALSYVYKLGRQPFAALHEAEKAHELAPNKDYVTREYIYAMEQAGLTSPALRFAREHAQVITPAEMRGLEGDEAAELARLATTPSRREAERYVIADKALKRYQELINEWQALGPEAHKDVLRARFDRLKALRARNRMQDVVDEYQSLRSEGVMVPRYALPDVAAAYLYLRQPDRARELYQQVLNDPAAAKDEESVRLNNETGLYYSLLEGEQINLADRVLTDAQQRQATWRYIKGVPQRIPNDPHLYAEQTAALNDLYADDTVAAQKRLQEMVDAAPRSVGLRVSLANVYRSRQWPRRAEEELRMAETLEPNSIDLMTMQGLTALDLQEWRQAEVLTDSMLTRFSSDLNTRNLARQWEIHNKSELRVSAYRGITQDSPVSGNGDMGIETVLYSPPIDYNWRAFVGAGFAEGDFDEGKGHYRWTRAGAEWRSRNLTAEAEVSSHSYGFGTKVGARVSAAYDLSDAWQIGGSAELRSRETPLRALTNDVSSNSLGAFVRWRGSERSEWTFSLSPSHFSDGNNRMTATVAGRQRLYTAPYLKADLMVDMSASHNTRDDVPYFSPRADFEIMPSIKLTHTLWRRYESALEQSFLAGAGAYSQRGFGTSAMAAIGYGLRYRYNDVLDVGATVTGISRAYDGQRERDVRILFDMALRF